MSQPQYRQKTRYASTFGAWTNYSSPYLLLETNKDITSVSTPGFRKLKRGKLPEHPHKHVLWWTESDYTTGSLIWTWPGNTTAINEYRGPAAIFGAVPDYLQTDQSDITGAQSLAIQRLLSELSLTRGSAAVTIAEVGRTAQMIGDTAIKLATAFRHLKKGKIQKFSETLGITVSTRKQGLLRSRYLRQKADVRGDKLQFAANTWLEFSYGWKPLINDVYTQCENLANYLTEKSSAVREAKGSAKSELITRKVTSGGPGTWITTRNASHRSRFRYVVRYTVPEGSNSIANVFGLTNPMIVAWELIPFSFVADWFLPVGNYLESLTATQGLVFHSGTLTIKQRAEISVSTMSDGKSIADQGGTRRFILTGGGKCINNISSKERVVLSSFPTPRLPSFKNPLSVSHATSALALIQSVFHGSSKFR